MKFYPYEKMGGGTGGETVLVMLKGWGVGGLNMFWG